MQKKLHSSPSSKFILNNNTITDLDEIATEFNKYFINIGQSLSDQIQSIHSSLDYLLQQHTPTSIFSFNPVNKECIEKYIKKIKNKSSYGYDNISKKTKTFNKKKHFHQKWMTDELLQLVIRKNALYKEWKATTNEQEYLIKKRNFRTFDNIVQRRKLEIKHEYFYDMFQAQKTDLKKSWGILNEALNRNKEKKDLPSEFIYKNKTIIDAIEIANSFNEYFSNIGPNLSKKIDPSVNSSTTYKSY